MGLSRRVVAGMAGLLAINIAIWLVVHVVSSSGGETAWTHVRAFLRGAQGADSWKPMEAARTYLADHRDHLYEEIFFTRRVKFQYPVTALLFIGRATRRTLAVVSWVATLATAGLTAIILRDELRQSDPTADHQSTSAVVGVYLTAGALALSFYPLVKAFSLGQIQTWVDAVFALLVLCWGRGHRAAGGFLAGCLCLVKPTWVLLLAWAVVRRQWRFLFAALSVVGAGTAAAAMCYGSINAIGYAHVLSFLARHGEAFYANQSLNGLLNRLLRNGSNLEWRDFEFPPEHAGVAAGTMMALAILTTLAWYVPRRTAVAGTVIDLCLAALTLTMTAPIAWEHHYGVMLPMYAAVTPGLLRDRPSATVTAALAVSFVIAGNYWPQTNRFATSSLSVLQSYVLAAACILLVLMYRALHTAEACGPAAA